MPNSGALKRPSQKGLSELEATAGAGGEDVIEKEDRGLGVNCPRKGKSGLLTATERQASFPDLSLITSLENAEVMLQATLVQELLIAAPIILGSKYDIVLSPL
ncbi:hypothetical protein C0991_010655 [Blastosporella zonata]|nr:hypothetical protein C0991_010655 [Blastosporella zonata]